MKVPVILGMSLALATTVALAQQPQAYRPKKTHTVEKKKATTWAPPTKAASDPGKDLRRLATDHRDRGWRHGHQHEGHGCQSKQEPLPGTSEAKRFSLTRADLNLRRGLEFSPFLSPCLLFVCVYGRPTGFL